MPPDSPLEENPDHAILREHHQAFRELVHEQIRYRMKYAPVFTEDDWVMRCFFSIVEFQQEFPDPEEREEYLHDLQEARLRMRQMRKHIAAMISEIFPKCPPND